MKQVPPLVDLVAFALPFLGWQLFKDGPTAFYVMQGLLICYAAWRVRRLAGWRWAPFMFFAWFVGLQQAACGALFPPRGGHICDDGTGFPFILVTDTVCAMVAAYYSWRNHAGPND